MGTHVLSYLLLVVVLTGCAASKPKFADIPYPIPPAAPPSEFPKLAILDFSSLPPTEREAYLSAYYRLFAFCKELAEDCELPEQFFLKCNHEAAGQDLLNQLAAEGFCVSSYSEFEWGKGFGCMVSDFELVSEGQAKVSAGVVYGQVGGQWGPMTLKKSKEKWVVTSWVITLIAQTLVNL